MHALIRMTTSGAHVVECNAPVLTRDVQLPLFFDFVSYVSS